MASGSNGRTWFGNMCYHLCASEADHDLLTEEPLKYLSQKLTAASDNFLLFCSDIVDVFPTSIFNPPEQTLEEEPTLLPVNETPKDVEIEHEEILAKSSTDKFLVKETLPSCVASVVENSEQLVYENELDGANSDFSISNQSSETTEKVVDITAWEDYISLVDKTLPVVEEFVSNDVHEEELVSVAQALKHSEENVNEDELDDDHVKFPISDHFSSERVEKVSDNVTMEEISEPEDESIFSSSIQSTESSCSRDSNPTYHELEPPKTIEPHQFLYDSGLQKIEESLIFLEADKSHSDLYQEETFQPIMKKASKKHLSQCVDAELDGDESETYDEDFSGSDCHWEFI